MKKENKHRDTVQRLVVPKGRGWEVGRMSEGVKRHRLAVIK